MTPRISIVIPTYNHFKDCLLPCLQSLIKYTSFDDVEIVIVANGCTDHTEAKIWNLNLPFVRLIRTSEPLGYTKATNLGIENARGEYIVLLNNDTILLEQEKDAWLTMLLQPFESDPKMAITGVTKHWCSRTKYHFIIFYCAMIKRSVFHELGLLDESFSPGSSEDIEYAIRVQNNGYHIAQVPDNNIEYWQYATLFPIYHQAEKTVHGETVFFNWDEVYKRNLNTIEKRFRKPVKYSIVVAVNSNLEQFKRCINSLYRFTDYMEIEIVCVYHNADEQMLSYINQISKNGPYVFSEANSDSVVDKYKVGISTSCGEYAVLITSGFQLLEQTKNEWLNLLNSSLVDNVELASFIGNSQEIPLWGFMIKKHWLHKLGLDGFLPKKLTSYNKKTAIISEIISYIPIYFS